MAWKKGESGNPHRGPNTDKPFRDALRMEIAAAKDHKGMRRLAAALMHEALRGDVPALREIADRLDGKVPQALAGSVDIGVTDPLAALLREINGKTRGLPDT